MRTYDRVNLWVSRIIVWFAIIVAMIPMFFVVTASLQKGDAFFSDSLLPHSITLNNYKAVILNTDFLIWLKNSLILCFGVGILQTLTTLMAAYAFSRIRFLGRKYGLMALLILQMFPPVMSISAIFGILAKLNLMDNLFVLVLVLAAGNAFNIWLMKGYLDKIPKELDEAAVVDGASHRQIFFRILMPLSAPMIAVIFLLSIIGVFAEFALSSLLLKSPENLTLAVGLQEFIKNQFSANWTQFSAAAIMASVPIVVIFTYLQKYIASGLTAGSVKG